ncbi:MAG: hypothetical protein WC365_10350 [Candidatus Babeliales bacterium]|jgi:hypothetical protein
MSVHPNAILLLTLTPDDLSRKTWKSILEESKVWEWDNPGVIDEEGQIKIGSNGYMHNVMESDYYKNMQISAKEGDIIVYNAVTYGYGEVIEWDKLEEQKNELEVWAKTMCEKFHCNYKIFITANYW